MPKGGPRSHCGWIPLSGPVDLRVDGRHRGAVRFPFVAVLRGPGRRWAPQGMAGGPAGACCS
eukprot:2732434-Alexandrium_andersonii.AAC.1